VLNLRRPSDVPLPALRRAPSGPPALEVQDDGELLRSDDADWLTYQSATSEPAIFSANQITPQNVASLAAKCILQLVGWDHFQPSPIIRGGRMYVTTAHRTIALDAATCRELWVHE